MNFETINLTPKHEKLLVDLPTPCEKIPDGIMFEATNEIIK